MYLQIKDWEKFQHYKERDPVWIKLHTNTFTDYKFSCLQDASKLLAICIWTLATRSHDPRAGLIPADFDYIKRQCNLGDMVQIEHLHELVISGYLIDASNALAICYQVASPETETYSKETDIDLKTIQKEKIVKKISIKEDDRFDQFWEIYGKVGSKQAAKKAFNSAIREIDFETIIDGVRQYQAKCRHERTEPKYVKHASTWLNKRCWEDDYTIYAKPLDRGQEIERAIQDACNNNEYLAIFGCKPPGGDTSG